ncbi:MAG: protein-tyrosine-phosphatase [Rhodospirillales bacterium]|jgi:predicted protein tyrosine phosphatase|nr:protein-tyrosine-phosphatase [Rhodospirillales bacterium]
MSPLHFSVLTVCGIEELSAQERRRVTDVLSLLDPEWPEIVAFKRFGAHRRRTLHFHDVIEPKAGMAPPTAGHMAEILRFGTELSQAALGDAGGEAHILVHCHMGVSRSTAAMLALLAQARPDEAEDALFNRLRQIRPQAWPNSLMVGHADALLGRGGRLVAALRRHYGHQIKRQPDLVDWMNRLGRGREVAMATETLKQAIPQ